MDSCSNNIENLGVGSCDDFRVQKRQSVINLAQDAQRSIIRDTNLAFPKKRPFRTIDRTPGKRRKKRIAEARLIFAPFHYAIQLSLILSQPIPKYPKGDYTGERAPELYKMPTGSKVYVAGMLVGALRGNPILPDINAMPIGDKIRRAEDSRINNT